MLKKNTGSQNLTFALINASSGAALTGATVTARRSIDGGAQATAGGSVTELGNGQYNFAPSQADTNGDLIGYLFTATSAVPVNLAVRTTAADLSDAVRLGLTAIPNATAGASGGLPLSADGSGRVDVLKINGTSQTARDLGASVLLSNGTGTGQVSLSSGAVTVGTNSDKTGYALTSGERTAIANVVEAEIIDDTDSEKVLEAITNKIASVNPSLAGLTLAAIAAAVRDVSNTSPAANSLGAAAKASADRMPGSGTLATSADVPSASTTATAVRNELAAELANLDAAVSSRSTFAGGAVASVTGNVGGNVAGSVASVTAGVTLADGAITDAKITFPAEAAGRPTTFLAAMRRVWEWATNKKTRDRSNGEKKLYGANGTTVLETQNQSTSGTVDQETAGA